MTKINMDSFPLPFGPGSRNHWYTRHRFLSMLTGSTSNHMTFQLFVHPKPPDIYLSYSFHLVGTWMLAMQYAHYLRPEFFRYTDPSTPS
jgi:hypothetical protein